MDIGAFLLEKLDQLATVAVQGRPLHASGDGHPASPAAVLERGVDLARAVAAAAKPAGSDELRALVMDFFDFLAKLGSRGHYALRLDAAFPPCRCSPMCCRPMTG